MLCHMLINFFMTFSQKLHSLFCFQESLSNCQLFSTGSLCFFFVAQYFTIGFVWVSVGLGWVGLDCRFCILHICVVLTELKKTCFDLYWWWIMNNIRMRSNKYIAASPFVRSFVVLFMTIHFYSFDWTFAFSWCSSLIRVPAQFQSNLHKPIHCQSQWNCIVLYLT